MNDLAARLAALSPEKRRLLERRLQTQGKNLPSDRITPRHESSRLPLSFAQQRLWFLEQLEPDRSFYNLPFTSRFSGHLAPSVIERALNEIVRRHEALRTRFVLENGEPVQLIEPELQIKLDLLDLQSVPEADRKREAGTIATQEAMLPFDLERGPLFHAKLLRLSPTDHILVVTMHHIVSDGWSMGVLYRELSALYNAFATNQPSPLPDLPMQYGDFALWQRNYLSDSRLEQLLSYWKNSLDGMPVLLELPTDHPRPRVQSFKGGSYSMPFAKPAIDELKELARKENATLFMALLAVFKVLLHRYSGVTDMVVGAPIANRNRVELEGLIGFFVNTLVLRTDFSGDPSFREVLSRVRDVTLDGFAHQDLPFEKLVEEMQPDRNLSHNPLFQVMFGLQNAEAQMASHNAPAQLSYGTSKFDLTLSATETAEGLTGVFEFNLELFDSQTIKSLANAFGTLLTAVTTDPDRPISKLPLVSPAEGAELIRAAATPGAVPEAFLVHQWFELQKQRTPDVIATAFGDEILTYAELDARANQLARALRERGAGPDVLVGLCVDRSLELPVAMLGVLKAGAAFVPLDPAYPKERLSYMLEDIGTRILLTQSHLVESLPKFQHEVWCLDTDWSQIAEYSAEPLEEITTSDALAYVIYTSGSTGRPKGVMVPHRCVCNSAQAQIEAYALPPGCRVLQFGSLSFDTSIYDLIMMIGCGGTLCLAPQDALMPGPPLVETLRRQQVNIITIPPSSLAVLPETELPDLHTLVAGGEAPTREVVARWLPGRRFFNAYGPTEATIWAAFFPCKDSDDAPPIGNAIANTQAYVLDDGLKPVPIGWPGEIYLGGAGIARGYLNRPGQTAEVYLPDPFSAEPGQRIYRTGDRAKLLPGGEIKFMGRIDQQLKLRGYRIELGEITIMLLSHPAIKDAVAVSQITTAGEPRIAAYCVAEEGLSPNKEELMAYLRQRLPEFMVPSSLRILEALPLNANGKLDYAKLSIWSQSDEDVESRWTPPRTPLEETIAEIFREVLELERIGIHENFFRLGGHSLLATRAIMRLNESFGISLPLRHLFEYTTVAELASAIEQDGQTSVQSKPTTIQRAERRAVPSPVADGASG
jgi:amino acid adenylation domain-containing protein